MFWSYADVRLNLSILRFLEFSDPNWNRRYSERALHGVFWYWFFLNQISKARMPGKSQLEMHKNNRYRKFVKT